MGENAELLDAQRALADELMHARSEAERVTARVMQGVLNDGVGRDFAVDLRGTGTLDVGRDFAIGGGKLRGTSTCDVGREMYGYPSLSDYRPTPAGRSSQHA